VTRSDDPASLWQRVTSALATQEFRDLARGFDRRPLIRMADGLGGPSMRLLHWQRLAELGRIPHSGEGQTVDAVSGIDAYGAPVVEVFMVSHRWLRPARDRSQAHPDSPLDEKAAAINEFSQWRREWVRHKHGFRPELYYWIDYCCIDQTDTTDAVAMLPLWVACCERFLRVETPDYHERAWCRVEPLLSHVFSFADHHLVIDPGFCFRWPYYGTEVRSVLLDPAEGQSTDPKDLKLIRPLGELAMRTAPANGGEAVRLNQTTVKCYRL
jgi:hypothetical protein